MKEHMPLEQKKSTAITVDPVFQDTFQESLQKSLDEQKQRFEKAKLAKQMSSKLKGNAPALTETEEAEQKQGLTQVREKIKENMPAPYSSSGLQGETETRAVSAEHTVLPEEMKALLDEIAGWRKVKAETSVPVKEAAKALKEAKNDMDAADAMADLVVSCSNYMDLNGSKMFKSSRRKKVVTDLLDMISRFIASADTIYYEIFELSYAKSTSATAAAFEDRLAASVMSSENAESLEEGIQKKKRRELIRAEYAEKERARLAGETDLEADEAKKLEFFTEEDRKKEYEELKKRKPGLTEEGYRILERAVNAERYIHCPQYHAIYDDSKDMYGKTHQSFSRQAASLLKTVNFDKNWNPISREDRERHEWNLRFLRAYDENDFATREKMIAEDFPRSADQMELPQFSKAELLGFLNEKDKKKKGEIKKVLKAQFEAWIEDFIRNGNIAAFIEVGKRNLTVDTLKQKHPSTTLYRKNNPLFEKKLDLQGSIASYISNYTSKNYYACIAGTLTQLEERDFKSEEERQRHYRGMDKVEDSVFENILQQLLDVEEHKNDPEVPYERTEISAGENSKLIEERKLEKTKKERDRIRGEIEAEEQKKREEKEAIRKAEKEAREAKKKEREQEKEEKEKAAAAEKETAEEKKSTKKKKSRMKPLSSAQKKARNKAMKEQVKTRKEAEEALSGHDTLLGESVKLLRSRQTETAKNIIKQNLTIDKDKNRSVAIKKRNAKNLSGDVDKATDMKIKLRRSVPLDIKKKTDHLTFSRFSDFAFMYGGQAELEKLVSSCGEGMERKKILEKVADTEEERKKTGYPVLDLMTAELLKMDLSVYDVSSDEAISRNAFILEKMARGVESYQKLVKELGGDDYFEYLKEKKIDGAEGDLSQSVLAQLDRLTSIAQYYRLRKLVIEDEGYIEGRTGEDTFESDRLKKLETLAEEQSMVFADTFRDKRRYGTGEFAAITMQEEEIQRLEQERFLCAPKWMYDAFSLTKLKDRSVSPDAAFGMVLGKGSDEMYSYYPVLDQEKNKEMNKVYSEVRSRCSGGVFGASPVFSGGKDKYLEKIEISDHWDRMKVPLINVLSYRRTPEEMREMMELLTIQSSPEWAEIQKDPEASAYYETAFREMAMREISSVYAAQKRVANSMALKILVMHPADLSMQMTTEIKSQLMGAIVASNIDCGAESIKRLEKLFSENNQDKRHLFDLKDFKDMEAVTGSTTFKTQNSGELIKQLIIGGDMLFDEEYKTKMSFRELEKKMFGKTGSYAAARRELDRYREELKKKEDKDPAAAEELKRLNGVSAEYFWLCKHPEFFTMENYLLKTPEGEFIFGKEFQKNGRTILEATNIEGMKNILDQGKLKPLNEEELKAYEQSLKDRNMPKYVLEEDPYGIGLYRTHMDALVEKDKKGKAIYQKGKLKVKNIFLMPDIDPVTGKTMKE